MVSYNMSDNETSNGPSRMTSSSMMQMSETSPLQPLETYIFASLSILCFIFGLAGSIFSLLYFVNKFKTKRTSSTLLFILINITDGVICFLIVFAGVSHITGPIVFTNSIFCDVWGVLWYVAARMSIFLIGFLSISRTYIISRPFAEMKIWRVVVPAGVYLLIMVVQQTFVFWFGSRYHYDADFGHCSIDPMEAFHNLDDEKKINFLMQVFFFICVPLENIFPWVLVIISCVLTIRSINKYNRQLSNGSNSSSSSINNNTQLSLTVSAYCRFRSKFKSNTQHSQLSQHDKKPTTLRPNEDTKRTATINILILTIVYLTINTFSVAVFSMDFIEVFFYDEVAIYDKISHRAVNIIVLLAWVYAVALNSACNVLVYFCRLGSLRRFTVATVTTCRIPDFQAATRHQIFAAQNRLRSPTTLSIV